MAIKKLVLSKAKIKRIKQQTPTVRLDQKTYDLVKDESRYFKGEYEEDKRKLFFEWSL